MNNSPQVSILVPVYNVEKYIERCARSLFEQTYENLEYIFVDDGSTDESIAILQKVMEDYPERKRNTKVIHHSQNKGLKAARNTAVDASNGSFVCHVDSDDWLERNAIELLVNKQLETDADIVTGNTCLDDTYHIKNKQYLNGGWPLDRDSLLKGVLTRTVTAVLWLRLIRKSLYTEFGIRASEEENGAEDYEVFPRLVYYSKKVAGIDAFTYHYNWDNTRSITNKTEESVSTQTGILKSFRSIITFISDKDSYLHGLVAGKDVEFIHDWLRKNHSNNNRNGFNTFLELMKESDKRYWARVGWNNPIKRFIESNYYLLKLYCMVRPVIPNLHLK